jgi:hypothetical protein
MKARAIARNVILAATLASAVSCKVPLVERPKIAKTSHPTTTRPHLCTRKVIAGGLNSSSHILFQDHPSILTKKLTKKEVRSQILLYHVLFDLIKNYGVRVVFLEGTRISEDVRETLHAKCDEECLNRLSVLFERCVSNATRLPCGYGQIPCGGGSRWLDRHGAEDFCLARILWYDYRNKNLHTVLLIRRNPSVLFTGFERNPQTSLQKLERYRLLLELRKHIEMVIGPKMSGEFEEFVLSFYKENIVKPRLRYVDKDAINGAISYSSKNTAMVIGADHMEGIEKAIRAIPFAERPTFYFVMPECQDGPLFSVQSKIIDVAAAITAEKKPKQNL